LSFACKILRLLLALTLLLSLPVVGQTPSDLISPQEIDSLRREKDPVVLDVRTPAEIQELGTLPGALTIPLAELPQRLDEIPKDRLILTA